MSTLSFLTQEKLQACIIENQKIEAWYPVFIEYLPKYDIDTPARVSGFLSQTSVECMHWTKFRENLNYSALGLRKTFPKYFTTDTIAKAYDRKPEAIANRAYANRMGNGNEASGDGWKFRGRGAIQVTGKYNYGEFGKWLYGFEKPLWDNPDYCATTEGVILSACWYWSTHGLNELADKKDVLGMTRRINGGTHGLDRRTKLFDRMIRILD